MKTYCCEQVVLDSIAKGGSVDEIIEHVDLTVPFTSRKDVEVSSIVENKIGPTPIPNSSIGGVM